VKASDAIRPFARIFFDTAPVVYYVEEDARYLSRVDPIFERIDAGQLTAITSPVTLAECLIMPARQRQTELYQSFVDLVVNGAHVDFVLINQAVAERAAEIRARYNLGLPDSFQVAVALEADCDAFLTNDAALKRVAEINVIVLDEVEPG
jgi:predicted nucleic acid-binding protein